MVKKIGRVVLISTLIGTLCAEQTVSLHVTNMQGKKIKHVVVGTPFIIRATVAGDTQNLAEPLVKGVDQFGKQRTQVSSNISMINGVTTVSKEYVTVVAIDQEGTFTLGPAQIEVDGKVIESQQVKLTVSVQNNSQTSERKEAFSTVEISKSSFYQGEPITCTLRFYYDNQGIRLEGIEKPEFKDFSTQGLEGPVTGKRTIKDEEYLYLEWTAEIYASKGGELLIPAIKSIYSTPATGNNKFFSVFSFGGGRHQEVIYSNALKVMVNPLPKHTPPVNAVGTFTDCKFSLNNNQATQGEGVVGTFTVKGAGNVAQIEHPALYLPDGLTYYDASSSLVPGGKQFEYVIQGTASGEHSIDSQNFTYFDLQSETYKTINSEPVTVIINKGVQKTVEVSTPEKSDDTLQKILKPISIITHGKWRNNYERSFSWLWFFLLSSVPLLGFCFFALKKRRDDFLEKNAPIIRYKRAFSNARATFASARKNNYDGQLYHMFITLFASRLKIKRTEVSESLIEETMRNVEFSEQEITKWRLLFSQLIETAFSSHRIENKKDNVFNQSAYWINELEKRI